MQYKYLTAVLWEYLVPAGHQLVPGGGAQRLDVVVLQADSSGRQLVQVRGSDLRAVVSDIVPAEVISQDEDDVRLLGRGQNRNTNEEQPGDERTQSPAVTHDEFVSDERTQSQPEVRESSAGERHKHGGLTSSLCSH